MYSVHHVYAIVRRDTPLPATHEGSARDVELIKVPWRELAAVIARRDDDAAPTMDDVLHHEVVVGSVRQQGPALPVRFGTVFRDESSLASAIADRYDGLKADLDRLGDKVELSLTALWSGSEHGASSARTETPSRDRSAGARYLYTRAEAFRRDEMTQERARMLARMLDQVLGAHAIERRVSLVPTSRIAARIVYLLDQTKVEAFRTAFDAIRGTRAMRLLLTGPWPPYSFVSRMEMDAGAATEIRAQLN